MICFPHLLSFETIQNFQIEAKIQSQIFHNSQEVKELTNQNVEFIFNFDAEVAPLMSGLYCKNIDQPFGKCFNYQIRFCCGKFIAKIFIFSMPNNSAL